MSRHNQHIVTHPRGWAVRAENGTRATSVHRTQAAAIDRGRAIATAQRTELVIHGQDGRIRARDSHGTDPNPPKG